MEASVLYLLGLSIGLLEMPHDMAAGFSRESDPRVDNLKLLVLGLSFRGHSPSFLQCPNGDTAQPYSVCEGTAHGHEYQEVKIIGATSEAGYHIWFTPVNNSSLFHLFTVSLRNVSFETHS